jgi:predicted enzyme related to lactoylglutathione lyase
MPEFTKPTAGTFCWVDVTTTDPAAAKKFYTTLFGWDAKDMPMPDGSTYTVAELGGKMVAGIAPLHGQAKKMGTPPHLLSYVAVDDAAASAKKAAALGGKVLAEPMAMGPGTMAVIADPTGAVFALWQAGQAMGTTLVNEPGALGWNELSTTDTDRAGKFYTGLFGWTADAQEMPGMVYTVFKSGEAMRGGMMQQMKEMAGAPSAWSVYFSVADADATTAKAKSLGANVMMPPTDIPNIGRFSFLADPQGAVFAVIKFLPPSK